MSEEYQEMRGKAYLIIGSISLLLILSCQQEEFPSTTPLPPRKRPSRLDIAKLIEIKETPTYTYDAKGRRDPFRPLILGREAQLQQKKKSRPLGPLENYDLDTLRLVGIVWGDMGKFAIIEAPDGIGYSVYPNTPIGKNNGRVKEILPNKIVIEETYIDLRGRRREREIVMELHSEEE